MAQPAQLTLPAAPSSVPAARRFVRDALHRLGAAAAVDDAQALVSELATNAVIHARTAFTAAAARQHFEELTREFLLVAGTDARPTGEGQVVDQLAGSAPVPWAHRPRLSSV